MELLISDIHKGFKNLEIEEKLFVVICLIGMGLSFLGGIMNIVMDMGIVHVMSTFAMAFIICIFLVVAIKRQKYRFFTYLTLLILTFGLYPSVWLTSGGSHGTAPLFYMFNFMIIGGLLSKTKVLPMILFNIGAVAFLFRLELTHPELILSYGSPTERMIDFAIFFFVSGIAAFLLAYSIMLEYNRKIRNLTGIQNELNILSVTDTLSGLNNRRYVMRALKKKIDEKSADKLTLIMIDIDRFKNINDTYGHNTGDEVIKKVSSTLRNSTRESDIVGRIGGEEFMVVLENIEHGMAVFVAEKLRAIIEDLKWEKVPHPVTISCGVYSIKEEDTLNDALEKVDISLYNAKDTGRNRVVAYRDIAKVS